MTLAFPKPVRVELPAYRKFVRQHLCVVPKCWKRTEAHHVIFDGQGKTGSKVDDFFCIPLCEAHHKEAHATRDDFETKYGLNLYLLIIQLLGEYIAGRHAEN